MSNVKCHADEVGPALSSMLTKRVDAAMCGACEYPQRTVAGMYKREQELAKADEAGLILTAVDLEPVNRCKSCSLNDGEICLYCIHE